MLPPLLGVEASIGEEEVAEGSLVVWPCVEAAVGTERDDGDGDAAEGGELVGRLLEAFSPLPVGDQTLRPVFYPLQSTPTTCHRPVSLKLLSEGTCLNSMQYPSIVEESAVEEVLLDLGLITSVGIWRVQICTLKAILLWPTPFFLKKKKKSKG